MQELTAIDLFAGCGGLTLGLKWAGYKVIGAVEIHDLAVETYRHNHPEVMVLQSDIATVTGAEICKKLGIQKGQLDLLAGCPPCQGFSSVRTLNGKKRINDARNGLVFEFLRLVFELEPKAVMMENVPGMAKDKSFQLFTSLLNDLGYDCTHKVLNVSGYEVPQNRRRLILLATNQKVDLAPKRDRTLTVRETIGQLPPPSESADPLHGYFERRTEKVKELISQVPRNGGSRNQLDSRFRLNCHKKFNGFRDVYGRMAWDKPSPTITSGCTNPSKGRFIHPTQNRAITLREAALLQGFPADYYFSLRRGRTGAAEMIGNALPPRFVQIQAQQLIDVRHMGGKNAWRKSST